MDKGVLDALLTAMLKAGGRVSDLLFITGTAALIEVDGRLTPFEIADYTPITSQFIEDISKQIIAGDKRLLADLAATGSCDCSYVVEGVARFRVNVYKEKNQPAIVMRKLQANAPSLDSLNLRPVFKEIVKEKTGIVFLTGATGSGKTTTLAALVNELNQTQPIHIVTLEDPIEFIHGHALAAVSQRELGRDFFNFAQGLRSALRQAPKVILLGEIRDRETMEIALTAAETGHLVFATLHTISAGQTINRILGFFSKDEEQLLRYRLSEIVRYVVSQRLIPKIDGSRLLISEVLGSNLRSRESIRYGESEGKTFQEIIDAATLYGWHSFDHCLLSALEENQISDETALQYCNDKSRMNREVDSLKRRIGRTDAGPSLELKLNPIKIKPPQSTPVTPPSPESDTIQTSGQANGRRVIQPRPQPK